MSGGSEVLLSCLCLGIGMFAILGFVIFIVRDSSNNSSKPTKGSTTNGRIYLNPSHRIAIVNLLQQVLESPDRESAIVQMQADVQRALWLPMEGGFPPEALTLTPAPTPVYAPQSSPVVESPLVADPTLATTATLDPAPQVAQASIPVPLTPASQVAEASTAATAPLTPAPLPATTGQPLATPVAATVSTPQQVKTPAAPVRPPLPTPSLKWLAPDNITLLLYVGAALMVISAGVFVASSWDAISEWMRFSIVALFAFSFLTVGELFYRLTTKLRHAGTTFRAVGLLLLPFTALAFERFVLNGDGTPLYWFVVGASLGVINYGYYRFLNPGRLTGYLAGFSLGILAASVPGVLNVPALTPTSMFALAGIFVAITARLAPDAGKLLQHFFRKENNPIAESHFILALLLFGAGIVSVMTSADATALTNAVNLTAAAVLVWGLSFYIRYDGVAALGATLGIGAVSLWYPDWLLVSVGVAIANYAAYLRFSPKRLTAYPAGVGLVVLAVAGAELLNVPNLTPIGIFALAGIFTLIAARLAPDGGRLLQQLAQKENNPVAESHFILAGLLFVGGLFTIFASYPDATAITIAANLTAASLFLWGVSFYLRYDGVAATAAALSVAAVWCWSPDWLSVSAIIAIANYQLYYFFSPKRLTGYPAGAGVVLVAYLMLSYFGQLDYAILSLFGLSALALLVAFIGTREGDMLFSRLLRSEHPVAESHLVMSALLCGAGIFGLITSLNPSALHATNFTVGAVVTLALAFYLRAGVIATPAAVLGGVALWQWVRVALPASELHLVAVSLYALLLLTIAPETQKRLYYGRFGLTLVAFGWTFFAWRFNPGEVETWVRVFDILAYAATVLVIMVRYRNMITWGLGWLSINVVVWDFLTLVPVQSSSVLIPTFAYLGVAGLWLLLEAFPPYPITALYSRVSYAAQLVWMVPLLLLGSIAGFQDTPLAATLALPLLAAGVFWLAWRQQSDIVWGAAIFLATATLPALLQLIAMSDVPNGMVGVGMPLGLLAIGALLVVLQLVVPPFAKKVTEISGLLLTAVAPLGLAVSAIIGLPMVSETLATLSGQVTLGGTAAVYAAVGVWRQRRWSIALSGGFLYTLYVWALIDQNVETVQLYTVPLALLVFGYQWLFPAYRRFWEVASVVTLLLPALAQATDDNWVYSALLGAWGVLLIVLGISLARRVLLISGVVAVLFGAIRQLWVVVVALHPAVIIALAGLLFMILAVVLILNRDRWLKGSSRDEGDAEPQVALPSGTTDQ